MFNRRYWTYDSPSPCKGCGQRTPDCHGKCGQYMEFKKAVQEEAKVNKIDRVNSSVMDWDRHDYFNGRIPKWKMR